MISTTGVTAMLTYAMTKTYLEDINFLLTTDKAMRFNKRQNRLYMDLDWGSVGVDDYIIIQCHSTLDPNDYSRVYNDSFLKPYLTAYNQEAVGNEYDEVYWS